MREKGVVILPSHYESIREMKNKDRLVLYDAIMKFGFFREEVELTGEPKRIFSLIKPNIISAQKRYTTAQENGAKGGAPKGNQNARKFNQKNNQSFNQQFNHDTDTETDTEKDILKFCKEHGINSKFGRSFYERCSRSGWKDNKGNPIRNWENLLLWAWKQDKPVDEIQKRREQERANSYKPDDLEEWPIGSGLYRLKGSAHE